MQSSSIWEFLIPTPQPYNLKMRAEELCKICQPSTHYLIPWIWSSVFTKSGTDSSIIYTLYLQFHQPWWTHPMRRISKSRHQVQKEREEGRIQNWLKISPKRPASLVIVFRTAMRTHEGAKKHSFNRLAQFTTRMLHIGCKEIESRSPSLFQFGFITPTRSHEAEERIEEQVEKSFTTKNNKELFQAKPF